MAAAPKNVRSESPRSEPAGCGVGELPGRLHLHAHVGDHELQALEVADGMAELLALLHVVQRVVECALRDAHGLRGDRDAGVVQRLHRDAEALADLADDAVAGDADVVEVDLAGGGALDAQLLLGRAERDAVVGLLDDERRDALGALVGVGLREHRVVLRDAGVGDPALDAVEHPVVAVADGLGLLVRGVGPGVGLGQAVREAAVTVGQPAQVVLLDLLATADHDRQRAELVDRGDQRGRHAHARDLLDDEHRGQRVGASSAVLLGHVRGVKVRGEQRGGGLLGEAGLGIDVGGMRRDLGFRDRADGLADGLVLLGQDEHVSAGRAGHGHFPSYG